MNEVFVHGMSRTGTTLLVTILDSHPKISMGYELLPGRLGRCEDLARLVREAGEQSKDKARRAGKLLKDDGHAALCKFVRLSGRTLVPPSALAEIFDRLAAGGLDEIDDLASQCRLCRAVVDAKRRLEGTNVVGFKANTADLAAFCEQFPDAGILSIVRDPRDVVASHLAADFGRTTSEIVRTWNRNIAQVHEHCTAFVRYEDLVEKPRVTLEGAFGELGIEFDDAMLRFFDSKASIHSPGQHHVNGEQLSQDFFQTSVGRWRTELEESDVRVIETLCGDLMEPLGYEREVVRGTPRVRPLLEKVREGGRRLLSRRTD